MSKLAEQYLVSTVAITCMIVITASLIFSLKDKDKQRIGSIICYTGEGMEYYKSSYASISEDNGMFHLDDATSISGNCVVAYKQGK